jgi:hypothetical protein
MAKRMSIERRTSELENEEKAENEEEDENEEEAETECARRQTRRSHMVAPPLVPA